MISQEFAFTNQTKSSSALHKYSFVSGCFWVVVWWFGGRVPFPPPHFSFKTHLCWLIKASAWKRKYFRCILCEDWQILDSTLELEYKAPRFATEIEETSETEVIDSSVQENHSVASIFNKLKSGQLRLWLWCMNNSLLKTKKIQTCL